MKMDNKKFVVMNSRLKDFLYSLGFEYVADEDKTHRQKEIFLFRDNNKLRKCIDFYTVIHKENQSNK